MCMFVFAFMLTGREVKAEEQINIEEFDYSPHYKEGIMSDGGRYCVIMCEEPRRHSEKSSMHVRIICDDISCTSAKIVSSNTDVCSIDTPLMELEYYKIYEEDGDEGEEDGDELEDSDDMIEYPASEMDKPEEYLENEQEEDKNQCNYSADIYVEYTICGIGFSDITITVGDTMERVRIYTLAEENIATSVNKSDYNKVRINWSKVDGAYGYTVYRGRNISQGIEREYKIEKISTVVGCNRTFTDVRADWDVEWEYYVGIIIKPNEKDIYMFDVSKWIWLGGDVNYTLKHPSVKFTKATVANNKAKLYWTRQPNASYLIYMSETEGKGYKLVKKITNSATNSYTYTGKKGHTYYFKLIYSYPEKVPETFCTTSCYMPKKVTTKLNTKITGISSTYAEGQYSNWMFCDGADYVYYYNKSGKLHVVSYYKKKLYDYTLTDKNKVQSKKVISLGSHDIFGAFYYGKDGNYYVTIGYDNPKESSTKTVIKVIKYSSSWKKIKTCNIKGNASNCYMGIQTPFEAGNCRMDMAGNILYITTGRTMFKTTDDGLNHQSNISFQIYTDKMTYTNNNSDYTSHSFNQFVKIQDSYLYLVNHGDAYERAVRFTVVMNYQEIIKKNKKVGYYMWYNTAAYSEDTYNVLKILGRTGDNYTGLEVGGMEVGMNNVMICGTSVPQEYKIAGISGSKLGYVHNVFLVVADKFTGKSTVKWITKYNPQKSKVKVKESRMVKISDDRFAILYTTTYKKKDTLNYVLVDNNGNVISKKTFKNTSFSAGSQPIVFNNSIVWIDKKKDSKTTYINRLSIV